MTVPRRSLLAGLLMAPFALRAQDGAVQVEGQAFARRVRVGGSALVLNGTGVRAVAWFKGYAAGLYLPSRATLAVQALSMPGAKRIELRMLHEAPAGEFVKAFRKGVQRNTAEVDLVRLAARIDKFSGLIAEVDTVRKGDVIDLDLEPGRGTAFSLNGTLRGERIAGDDFYAALLRSFVGDRPYDVKLRAGLLGGKG